MPQYDNKVILLLYTPQHNENKVPSPTNSPHLCSSICPWVHFAVAQLFFICTFSCYTSAQISSLSPSYLLKFNSSHASEGLVTVSVLVAPSANQVSLIDNWQKAELTGLQKVFFSPNLPCLSILKWKLNTLLNISCPKIFLSQKKTLLGRKRICIFDYKSFNAHTGQVCLN